MPVEHLQAFAIICREGSFEAAARKLHITPSAVSQRVRSLEQRVGTVLLQRTRPVTPTRAGETVLRAARQIEQVLDDASRELADAPYGGVVIPLVINADTLATWFMPALARASRELDTRFEIIRADETVSTEQLRRGAAMAAVTAVSEPVPGCTVTPLGIDRYQAVASPGFVSRYFATGFTAAEFAQAPMIEFDRVDRFQQRLLASKSRAMLNPPRHYVPSSMEFAQAIKLGMGWGMLPRLQCEPDIAAGELVPLGTRNTLDQPLFWQRWNLASPLLDGLTRIILDEAGSALIV